MTKQNMMDKFDELLRITMNPSEETYQRAVELYDELGNFIMSHQD